MLLTDRLFWSGFTIRIKIASGEQALTKITSNEIAIVAEKHQKSVYTTERDKALAIRFFYYSYLLEKRYDACLRFLSKEFFLSETVISQRLMSKQEYIKQIREANTSKAILRRDYPQFNWG
jgi:hypothetical protein